MTLTSHVTNAAGQGDLGGNMFPIDHEIDVARCEVIGEIPAGLHGSFVRNGPNPMFEPIGKYHMFDGDGMLHGVDFADGTASYRNRWIRSRGLGAEIAARPRRLPRSQRRHELPRRLAHRRCRSGEEPGQHPHRAPRRASSWPCGSRASRPRSPPISRRSASGTSTAHSRER